MGEGEIDRPPVSESTASRVNEKFKKLAVRQMDSGFNPQNSRLGYHRTSFATLMTAVEDARDAGFPTSPGGEDGVDKEVANQRAEGILSLVAGLRPTSSELDKITDKEGLETLFGDDSVTSDFRLTDFY